MKSKQEPGSAGDEERSEDARRREEEKPTTQQPTTQPTPTKEGGKVMVLSATARAEPSEGKKI